MMLRVGVLVLFAVGASLAHAEPGTVPSHAAGKRCEFRDTQTVAENRRVRVYTVPERNGFGREFAVAACYKPTGKVLPLDFPDLGSYAFLPPALALRGTIVGYAYQSDCARVGGSCATGVQATDMKHAGTRRDGVAGGIAGPRGDARVKVGSLRVSRGGRLVWISCPEPRPARPRGRRAPNCVRPGARNRVYRLRGKGPELELLDRGRTIDPSSLRLWEGVASWIHGNQRRRARIR
jgi:hypothetical protein